MTLPRLRAIHTAWRRTPPAAVSIAAIARWLGAMKPTTPGTAAAATPDEEAEDSGNFLKDFMDAGGAVPPELLR